MRPILQKELFGRTHIIEDDTVVVILSYNSMKKINVISITIGLMIVLFIEICGDEIKIDMLHGTITEMLEWIGFILFIVMILTILLPILIRITDGMFINMYLTLELLIENDLVLNDGTYLQLENGEH
jgi:hypothetical protein